MAADGFLFAIHHQEQTHWCWAATAVSISHFYDQASPWIQCILVDDEFGFTNFCCDGASSTPACDRPWHLDLGLKRVGHFSRLQAGPAETLEEEIAGRRPMAARIRWSGGGAHFPVINGYVDIIISLTPFVTERHLSIQDPWYGESVIPFNTFRTSYHGLGTWIQTYFTKR